jgi:hypothetical protein
LILKWVYVRAHTHKVRTVLRSGTVPDLGIGSWVWVWVWEGEKCKNDRRAGGMEIVS